MGEREGEVEGLGVESRKDKNEKDRRRDAHEKKKKEA